jgi:hypothetical protein
MPRLYTAASIANDTILDQFRDEWEAALCDTGLSRNADDDDVDAYDVYNALLARGDEACAAVAAKIKALADHLEYTEAAAQAAKRARAATMLSGTVPCPDFEYTTAEQVSAEAAAAFPSRIWVAQEVPLWFKAYTLARAHNAALFDALCHSIL